jgi:hypothetical protein
MDDLENRVETLEHKVAILRGEEWTKQVCGTCHNLYTNIGDRHGICHVASSSSIDPDYKACKRWVGAEPYQEYTLGGSK